MQTLSVEVDDEYMNEFINYVKKHDSHITIKDPNLEMDPYFYERRAELDKIRADIDSGKMEMLSEKEYEAELEKFFAELEK